MFRWLVFPPVAFDDQIDDSVPYLSDVAGTPITLRQFLSHTSGTPNDGHLMATIVSQPLDLGQVEVPMSSKADFRCHITGSFDRRVTDRETLFTYI